MFALAAAAAGLLLDTNQLESKAGEASSTMVEETFRPKAEPAFLQVDAASMSEQEAENFMKSGRMQAALGLAKDRLTEMHFYDIGDKLKEGETSWLVGTMKENLQEGLDALKDELKKDPKNGRIPSVKDWFKSQDAMEDYKNTMDIASSIPLDDEGDALVKEIDTGFVNMLLETGQRIKKNKGDVKKVVAEVRDIARRHSSSPSKKLALYAKMKGRHAADLSIIATNMATAKYGDLDCEAAGKALALTPQAWCQGVFGNHAMPASLCIDRVHDFQVRLCDYQTVL